MTLHSATTSSLLTRSTLGSHAGFARSSCGFTLLLRLDDGFAELVSLLGSNPEAEGIKTMLDRLDPVGEIGEGIRGGVVRSDGDAFRGGLSPIQFKGSNCGAKEVVGDTVDVFEFIRHAS